MCHIVRAVANLARTLSYSDAESGEKRRDERPRGTRKISDTAISSRGRSRMKTESEHYSKTQANNPPIGPPTPTSRPTLLNQLRKSRPLTRRTAFPAPSLPRRLSMIV